MSTITKISKPKSTKVFRSTLWFEKLMAILALLNLVLVLFDLSYIPWRDLYFQYVRYQNQPILNQIYDPIKGIEINRETQAYLDTVESLKKQVNSQGLAAKESDEILQKLRDLSTDMINQNPFAVANKTGTLQRIKSHITKHMGVDSAKLAFQLFWSQPHLNENTWNAEISFYNDQIKPLIETNYFRHFADTVGFVDNFWLIDIWFVAIFALEFLIRSWLISRRYTEVSWLDAMLWRWFDLFLLIPFWRELRVIPVTIRLSQAELIDLSLVKRQLRQGLTATIATDISQVVVFEVIDQLQDSIRTGEIAQFISRTHKQNYIDINNINETAEITKIVLKTIIKDVLPELTPDLEALLNYSVEKTLKLNPAYASVTQLPGLERLQKNLTEKMVKQTVQIFADTLNSFASEDKELEKLLDKVVNNFTQAIGEQLTAKKSLTQIEHLLVAMLEEIKLNYVLKLLKEDQEQIFEKTRVLQQKAKKLSR